MRVSLHVGESNSGDLNFGESNNLELSTLYGLYSGDLVFVLVILLLIVSGCPVRAPDVSERVSLIGCFCIFSLSKGATQGTLCWTLFVLGHQRYQTNIYFRETQNHLCDTILTTIPLVAPSKV